MSEKNYIVIEGGGWDRAYVKAKKQRLGIFYIKRNPKNSRVHMDTWSGIKDFTEEAIEKIHKIITDIYEHKMMGRMGYSSWGKTGFFFRPQTEFLEEILELFFEILDDENNWCLPPWRDK